LALPAPQFKQEEDMKPKKTPKAVEVWAIVDENNEICSVFIIDVKKKDLEEILNPDHRLIRVRITPVRRKKGTQNDRA
jgi:hypothetical protein